MLNLPQNLGRGKELNSQSREITKIRAEINEIGTQKKKNTKNQ
jgi:hypothetical protein